MQLDKYYANLLVDYYGSLLTSRQQEVLADYLVEDLSMQEIADDYQISKSAVSDLIKRSIEQLEHYEMHLKMIEQAKKIDELIIKMKNDSNVKEKYIKELLKINRG